MTITLRANKSQALTFVELDGNFTDLDGRTTTLEGAYVKTVNGVSPTSNAVTITTANITENTNLYFTNARADARIAAAGITALSNVDYSGTPTTNHVLTWDGDSWVSAAPPGLGGGEANGGNNLGSSGSAVFSSKVGADLQFRKIIGTAPIVATQNTNDITLTWVPAGDVNVNTQKIINVVDPTANQHAATKAYADLKLALTGGTMSGAIAMGTAKITGLGDPAANQDAATKVYVDTADNLRLLLAGGTMSGNIAMGTNKITGMGDPTAAQDASTKAYVDAQVSSLNSDKIIEGNSQVEVIDGGTGSVVITVDGVAEQTIVAANTTFGGSLIIPDAGNIGSVSDTDAIAIAAGGAVTFSQEVIVTGNLTVNGTTTTLNTATLQVDDGLIMLQNSLGANPNTNDLGIIMERGTTGANAFIGFDESADKFVLGTTTATGDATGNLTIDTSSAGASTLLVHTVEAALTGNVTGNVSGSSGSCTGTAAVATTFTVADEGTDTTCFPVFATAATGNVGGKTDSVLTYNSANGTLGATTFSGIATSAQYADLAEIYTADAELAPGTVVTVGGDAEITTAGPDDAYLAGVISTNPAYLMNSAADGAPVALVGRVPVRVVGNVNKGEAVFATHNGKASTNGQGPIVGIALETISDLGEKNVECMLKV